jgi:hypothetical protein
MHRAARWTLLALGGLGLTFAIVGGVGAGGLRLLRRSMCRADELASIPAPDGRLRAVCCNTTAVRLAALGGRWPSSKSRNASR